MTLSEVSVTSAVGYSLREFLSKEATADSARKDAGDAVLALAGAAIEISRLAAKGPLAGSLGANVGSANADGDDQKELDVRANDLVLAALDTTSTRYYASEEEDAILTLDGLGRLAVAVDPLDGSSNIDVNISVGTIFSIFEASSDGATASFFRPGSEQVAAGYFIYGPHTALVVTLGNGTHLFVLDPDVGEFKLAQKSLTISDETAEFAINSSNYRHWRAPVKNFIEDCLDGATGPRGKEFNMRWVASLVAEAHRIFSRGGIFLYPADERPGYERGRLRLIYEATPIAMLVEQAGGGASDGYDPILSKVPSDLHERTPLIFGSSDKMKLLESYHADARFERDQSPLFGKRGLYRT